MAEENEKPDCETSLVANQYSYTLPIREIMEEVTGAITKLRDTNRRIECSFTKAQLSYTSLSAQEFIQKIMLAGGRAVMSNHNLHYSLYGQQFYSLKAGINKRSEMVAHLNIMLMNLNQKSKDDFFDNGIYFSSEEELFNCFLKVFHIKLFQSPLFRKVYGYYYLWIDLQ